MVRMAVTTIDISYARHKVEQYFTDFDKMKRTIGNNETKAVKRRINELIASTSFYEYLVLNLGNPHSLSGELSDCYSVSITGNTRLIVRPLCENHKPETLIICTGFEVIGVVNYHEGKEEWLIP